MGKRAPRAPSIVGWFSRLPWLAYAGDSVAPDVYRLALGALQRPLAAMSGDAQNDNTLATTPDGPRGEETVVTVRFTRSMKAVLSRPERPNPCKLALRASSVPRRITCVTRTSLRRRELFFTWP